MWLYDMNQHYTIITFEEYSNWKMSFPYTVYLCLALDCPSGLLTGQIFTTWVRFLSVVLLRRLWDTSALSSYFSYQAAPFQVTYHPQTGVRPSILKDARHSTQLEFLTCWPSASTGPLANYPSWEVIWHIPATWPLKLSLHFLPASSQHEAERKLNIDPGAAPHWALIQLQTNWHHPGNRYPVELPHFLAWLHAWRLLALYFSCQHALISLWPSVCVSS